MTTGLFIGRFQPFHTGHLDAVKQILRECGNIIIVIGSAQYANTRENPFTADEREQIIRSVLGAEGISNYTIVKLDDIDDDTQWVEYVKGSVPEFNQIYTGNEWVTELFTNAGYDVKKQDFNIDISGMREREYIKNKNLVWKEFLHPTAIQVLNEIDGFTRIQNES